MEEIVTMNFRTPEDYKETAKRNKDEPPIRTDHPHMRA